LSAGRVFLIASWVAQDAPPGEVLPVPVLERIRSIADFVVEDAKSARAFLAACGHPMPMREIRMAELNEHTPSAHVPALLEPVLQGRDLGVLSEAGAPGVADPGAVLVAECHAQGIAVRPLVGPSSLLLALMASGLDGQRFRFLGYLPADGAARKAALAELERQSQRLSETQVFIETPYRNDALLADLLLACKPTTRLAVAVDLTSANESIRMRSIESWRRDRPAIGKRPAIFLLLA
jgi:16S rRNA (cytidine1402-2'-O)-methyltransferase